MARIQLTAALPSWARAILSPQPPEQQELQVCHHIQLIFVYFVERRFCPGGLKLLASSGSRVLASQSPGITGMNHHARPGCTILKE